MSVRLAERRSHPLLLVQLVQRLAQNVILGPVDGRTTNNVLRSRKGIQRGGHGCIVIRLVSITGVATLPFGGTRGSRAG